MTRERSHNPNPESIEQALDAAEAEVARLRAQVAAVEALCDEEEAHGEVYGVLPVVVASRIRAALATGAAS
jgi:hypothetical protein